MKDQREQMSFTVLTSSGVARRKLGSQGFNIVLPKKKKREREEREREREIYREMCDERLKKGC